MNEFYKSNNKNFSGVIESTQVPIEDIANGFSNDIEKVVVPFGSSLLNNGISDSIAVLNNEDVVSDLPVNDTKFDMTFFRTKTFQSTHLETIQKDMNEFFFVNRDKISKIISSEFRIDDDKQESIQYLGRYLYILVYEIVI